MKIYTYSQARQHLSELLDQAQTEEVIIHRRDGSTFSIVPKKLPKSPFDVKGLKTKASTEDVIEAVRVSRKG
jgi:prevent-host-death family protein